MPTIRTINKLMILTGTALVGVLGITSPASAATQNGVCESGEICIYYSPNRTGSLIDLPYSSRASHDGLVFKSAGSGQGQSVRNNAASVWNRSSGQVTVFYNVNWGGILQRIASGAAVNLTDPGLRNNNASHTIGDSSIRFPLATTKSVITGSSPRWCYTSNSNCHHDYNAADIFAPTNTSVVSPVSGTVVNVQPDTANTSNIGARVQIRDSYGRLWYMAHMKSGSLLVSLNSYVTKGQQIGVVGYSSDAAGTDPHLHIDMLVGYSSRPSCSGTTCTSYPFVNNQPLLREAYNLLP